MYSKNVVVKREGWIRERGPPGGGFSSHTRFPHCDLDLGTSVYLL